MSITSAAHNDQSWRVSHICALGRVYDLYTDFVLKNPFYEVEMPVRCELFDQNIFATIGMLHRRWGIIQN